MENGANNTCFLWLEVNNHTTLDDLNDQFTIRHLGGIIFTGILMVLGIFGNITVLWIYIRSFKASNYRTYLIYLAVMDIVNCCVGMPFLIYYMSHFLLFPSPGFCRFGRFEIVFTTNCSTYILIAIAYERYRKVCRPTKWQFSQKHVRISCFVASFIALMTSWPTLVLYGKNTVKTPIPGIRCWTDDEYKDTSYPTIYYLGLYIFNFFFVVPMLLVAYIQILRFLRSYQSKGVAINTRKTTITLLAVTTAFVLSAIPHYSLVIASRILTHLNCIMSFSQGFAFYTFVFSILINNSVNPFIYCFLDRKFKRRVKQVSYRLARIQTPEPEVSESDADECDDKVVNGLHDVTGSGNDNQLTENNKVETNPEN